MLVLAGPNLQLPWSSQQFDNTFYRRVLLILLIPFLFVSVVIPYIKLPEPTRQEIEHLPPQLARMVLEVKELPKPIPPPVEVAKPEEKKPDVPKVDEKKVEPVPVKVPVPVRDNRLPPDSSKKPPQAPPGSKSAQVDSARLEQAQSQAKATGVLQFADDLAEMRDAVDVKSVKSTSKIVTASKGDAAQVERNMISSGATAKSGGVVAGALSRNVGGSALSGRSTTVVSSGLKEVSEANQEGRSKVGGGTGTGAGGAAGGGGGARDKSYRSEQAIKQKMDEAKGRIFGIYNRALRQNPTLKGAMTFKLVIEPDGAVSNVQIVSSELKDEDLEKKILASIRAINFGPSDVMQTTLNYSFDFLPF